MIPTAVLTKLATLGLSEAQAEAVAGMLSAVETATQGEADAVTEKSREKVRARVQKWRAKQPVTLPSVTERYVTAHASASPAPDLENKQTNKEERKQDTAPVAREFDESFWPVYPLKRGKADALKAFLAARKRASLEIIMAGVRRYAAERAGEDSKFTKHAQGWLSGDHWTDEPAPPRPARQAHAPPETVGSLSLKQLFRPRTEADVADNPNGRVETGGRGRLEESPRSAQAFTVTGDFLGRI